MSNLIEIELPENFTVANIHPIHERFEEVVDDKEHDSILIKAASVMRADTAGVQLLHAFVMAAKERNIALDWDHPSEKLCSVAGILGMSKALGLNS